MALARHLLDVGTSRERLLGAGDDHAADRIVRLERVDRGGQVGIELRIERIQRLWPVEADDADLALGFDKDGFVAHACGPALAQVRPRKSRLPISRPHWRRMS